MPSHQKIYENRKKVIEFLKQPGLKKAKGRLENLKTGGRCCLGHMCVALGIDRRIENEKVFFGNESLVIPIKAKQALGLYSQNGKNQSIFGDFLLQTKTKYQFDNLAEVNDYTEMSPYGFGCYLESVIMGGDNTPWKKIRNIKE